MTIIELWTLAAIIPAVVWAVGWVIIERNVNIVPKIKITAKTQAERVTVIVPAYNEQDMIERCVRGIMMQNMPNLDLIVVDDRSQDQTPIILKRLCEEFPGRMRVVTNTHKSKTDSPKTHALLQGITHTDAPWLCFVDADTWFIATDGVNAAMTFAQEQALDFLTLYPNSKMVSTWDKIVEPGCTMTFGAWYSPAQTNNPRSKVAMGNATFILVRRTTYERVGGHEAIRDDLADDIALAQLFKAGGGRVMIANGADIIALRMYPDTRRSWHGWCHIHANAFTTWQLLLSMVSSLFNTVFTWLSAAVTVGLWAMHHFDWESIWRTPALVWCSVVGLAHVVLWRYYTPLPVHRGWCLTWPVTMAINVAIFATGLLQKSGLATHRWRGDFFAAQTTTPQK